MQRLTTLIRRLFVVGIFMAMVNRLHAQHYPAGSEGIKAATTPPPGLYFQDYNSFYFSDRTPGYQGQLEHTVEFTSQYPYALQNKPDFKLFTYEQAPRLLWITSLDFLDADYGMAVRVPFVYKKHDQGVSVYLQKYPGLFAGPAITSVKKFGLGDVQVEPIILSWHLKHFDIVTGYSFWAPSGDYDHTKLFLLNLGNGYWTHMFTLGTTWYPDEEKTWAFSLLNRFEINMEQSRDTYIEPTPSGVESLGTTLGDIYTLEWAVSKTVVKGVDVGITGYYQQQVTPTQGPTFWGPTFFDERVRVAGVGPEISVNVPKWNVAASLRYAYEFTAEDHPQGNLITLTLTKGF